jgi:hypothetical protein
MTSAFLNL